MVLFALLKAGNKNTAKARAYWRPGGVGDTKVLLPGVSAVSSQKPRHSRGPADCHVGYNNNNNNNNNTTRHEAHTFQTATGIAPQIAPVHINNGNRRVAADSQTRDQNERLTSDTKSINRALAG